MALNGAKYHNNDEYYTPLKLVRLFGKFDYDPATTKEKAEKFGILHYDTIETNGLTSDWRIYRRIWINPPFTLKCEFMKKAVETFLETEADIFILFPLEFMTTKRFHEIFKDVSGIIYIPNGRIKFENKEKNRSPSFGTCIRKLSNGPMEIRRFEI